MDTSKPWYKSMTIWSGITTFAVATYGLIGQYLAPAIGFHLPAIPGGILAFLGAVGVYGRSTAQQKIG